MTDELKAGAELDLLIATKVMGWDQGIVPTEMIVSKTPQIWRPSVDIAAAWEVVEKMATLNFDSEVALSSKLPSDDSERWYCHFQTGDDNAPWRSDYRLVQNWAPTAPLAICRAALKAVEKS